MERGKLQHCSWPAFEMHAMNPGVFMLSCICYLSHLHDPLFMRSRTHASRHNAMSQIYSQGNTPTGTSPVVQLCGCTLSVSCAAVHCGDAAADLHIKHTVMRVRVLHFAAIAQSDLWHPLPG